MVDFKIEDLSYTLLVPGALSFERTFTDIGRYPVYWGAWDFTNWAFDGIIGAKSGLLKNESSKDKLVKDKLGDGREYVKQRLFYCELDDLRLFVEANFSYQLLSREVVEWRVKEVQDLQHKPCNRKFNDLDEVGYLTLKLLNGERIFLDVARSLKKADHLALIKDVRTAYRFTNIELEKPADRLINFSSTPRELSDILKELEIKNELSK